MGQHLPTLKPGLGSLGGLPSYPTANVAPGAATQKPLSHAIMPRVGVDKESGTVAGTKKSWITST